MTQPRYTSAMNWFYVLNAQKNGPVSDAQLEELVRSGTINRDTLIWCEGMADWQPLAVARPGEYLSTVGGATTGVRCVECGHIFAPSELIQIHQSSVCAACKPVFLQRLSEGAAVPSAVGLWRQGKRVVTVTETIFPDRCIKCNQPVNGFRLKRILYWHHLAYYLLLLCSWPIYFILYLIVRKKAVVYIGLCEKHRVSRKYGLIVGWIGMLGGLILLIGGGTWQSGISALVGLVMFLVGAIAWFIWGRNVWASKITKENVWVSGVTRSYLENLPNWPGV